MASTFISLPVEGGGGGGTVLLSNIEAIGNNTILGNNTGSSHYPVAMTAAQTRDVLSIGMVKLYQSTFADSLSPSVTISGISQSYSTLKIIVKARSTYIGGPSDYVTVNFNSDVAANYEWTYMYAGTIVGSSIDAAASIALVGLCASEGNGVADSADQSECTIVDYASSVFQKTLTFNGAVRQSNPLIYAVYGYGLWKNTAAITDIIIAMQNGNFVQGSTITIYGMP